jgi:hypothetical protein
LPLTHIHLCPQELTEEVENQSIREMGLEYGAQSVRHEIQDGWHKDVEEV